MEIIGMTVGLAILGIVTGCCFAIPLLVRGKQLRVSIARTSKDQVLVRVLYCPLRAVRMIGCRPRIHRFVGKYIRYEHSSGGYTKWYDQRTGKDAFGTDMLDGMLLRLSWEETK